MEGRVNNMCEERVADKRQAGIGGEEGSGKEKPGEREGGMHRNRGYRDTAERDMGWREEADDTLAW
jgi:hypothetical protein